ncbi:MAG: N-acetyltransferase [Bacteroidaceae bacterium]|nr:N-acetyltransferase [Bacteroidaceae bacterium]
MDDCSLAKVSSAEDLVAFRCGDEDLDDFFVHDAFLYSQQLLGKTYFFVSNDEKNRIVGAFTVSNDSIKASLISKSTRNSLQRKIPNSKRTRSYPAVLIGRLGVAASLKGNNIGSDIIEYIKAIFSDDSNRTGCRYVVVDAYNRRDVLSFNEKNGFKYLYPTEEEERNSFGLADVECLNSRMMYFDLIAYSEF